ncbi:MAG: concentrative nucleoside transporter, CNT family [Elusimicrobia bacterium]|nr:MAG: concentrative nucleoside transporter, CNT family [Elusimicrobiota bacterium]
MNRTARLSILGRTWAFFTMCGLFGALAMYAVAGDPAPKPAAGGEAPASAVAAPTAQERMDALRRREAPQSAMNRATSFLGIFVLIGLCLAMSNNRRKVDWRLVAWGLGLQFAFGLLILKTGPGLWFFSKLNDGTMALLSFTQEGSNFLFRSFLTGQVEGGFVNFTFNVLPTIIFFSSLMTVGYYVGFMQAVVNVFAWVMQRSMKCSGAETLSTAANIFVGQTEAPLVVKPYVKDMTQSELLAVMAGGFANTAGGVLAAYVGMLHSHFPDIAGHLIAQSVMSAPAALACAKIVIPETEKPLTGSHVKMTHEKIDANVIDAAARGASEGLQLAFNVAAMLLAFIALIAMVNALLQGSCRLVGLPVVSLEQVMAVVGWPLAWVMGVPTAECWAVGRLIGVKTVVNEFVAYLQMADMMARGELSYRSVVIASYALSGFANFSSIAIQIGGISGIAPTRRHDLAKLGFKAMVTGAIATFMTATIAGVLVN